MVSRFFFLQILQIYGLWWWWYWLVWFWFIYHIYIFIYHIKFHLTISQQGLGEHCSLGYFMILGLVDSKSSRLMTTFWDCLPPFGLPIFTFFQPDCLFSMNYFDYSICSLRLKNWNRNCQPSGKQFLEHHPSSYSASASNIAPPKKTKTHTMENSGKSLTFLFFFGGRKL